MQCAKCGRELKDKKSIERGYGPICWQKVQAAEKEREDENHEARTES